MRRLWKLLFDEGASEREAKVTAEKEALEREVKADKEKLLDKPWRRFEREGNWSEDYEVSLKSQIQSIKHLNVTRSRILLLGPTLSGKSSFINSVATIDNGYISAVVEAGSSCTSVTVVMNEYLPKRFATNFALIDTMGIAESKAVGIQIDDTRALMAGELKVAYKFNPASPLSKNSPALKQENPTLEDVGHCTVIVLDARIIDTGSITEMLMKKFEDINEHAKLLNQRKVLVLTKIDLACGEIGEDIENVYKSRKMYQIVKQAEELFGVPEMNIFPVQNYSTEVDIDWKMNILILLAIRQMVRYSHDRLENYHDQCNTTSSWSRSDVERSDK